MEIEHLFAQIGAASLIDLTHPLHPGIPVWPGHPHFCQLDGSSLQRGDASSWNALSLGEHTGTHIDAPSHFIPGGASVERIAARRFFGRMVTIGCTNLSPDSCVEPDRLAAWEEANGTIRADDAVAFHFGWDRFWEHDAAAFLSAWPGLSGEMAAILVARGVRLVATDCLSIDRFSSPDYPAHRFLLGAGIIIGENFANLGVVPPVCHLACMPLPIVSGSGSPVRAIAFQLDRTLHG